MPAGKHDARQGGNEEGFLNRWSRVKSEQAKTDSPTTMQEVNPEKSVIPPAPRDEDMPAIETLNEESDYTGFLSPEVSEGLRKLALRKLFSSPEFNIRDGLDDYDGVYTHYAKLGNIVTADMKHQMEMEAKKLLEKDKQDNKSRAEQQAQPDDTLNAGETLHVVDELDEMSQADIDADRAVTQSNHDEGE